MHLKRWLTAIVLLPLLFLILLKGEPLVFSVLVALVALIAMNEYLEIVSQGPDGPLVQPLKLCAYGASAALILAAHLQSLEGILFVLALNLILAGVYVVLGFSPDSRGPRQMAVQVQGVVYVPVLLSFLVWLRHSEAGAIWVIWTWLIIAASDTGAFYAGTYLGRHKLCPKVSPKKTVEGAAGGIALAVLVAVVFSLLFLPELNLFAVAVFAVIATITGQIGDLFESALKRAGNIKDSGSILPGHGGILDRIDALLFALPVAFVFKAYLS